MPANEKNLVQRLELGAKRLSKGCEIISFGPTPTHTGGESVSVYQCHVKEIMNQRRLVLSIGCLCSVVFQPEPSLALDRNNNQQSDVWEAVFNATGLGAGSDSDLDGFSNRDESKAGTNPFEPTSFPAIKELAVATGRATNTFLSAEGKIYTIEEQDGAGAWVVAGDITGSGDEVLVGLNATNNQQLFRFSVSDVDTDGDGLFDWEELAIGYDPFTNRTDRYDQSDSNRVVAALNSMSTVTVAVLDGDISERWPDSGFVAIRRTGGLKPITVNISIGGSATRGIDYTTTPDNEVVLEPGDREVWVEFVPVADADDVEAGETISFAILGGTNYVPGSATSVVINLSNETATSPPSPKESARFLVQAAFGPDQDSTNDVDQIPENVEETSAIGFDAWIEDQFTRPVGLLQPFVEFAPNMPDFYTDRKVASWWNRAMGVPSLVPGGLEQLPDPLRQRVAFALSQILVISDRPETLAVEPEGMANYYDMLLTNSFRNYRDLLFDVTVHPCMGFYLSHLKNRKPDPVNNIYPDENYAREVMQLFSIGLWELNQDGTRRLDTNGLPIPTYDNSDITEFARVFTGLSYGPESQAAFLNAQQNFLVPMKMWDSFHDLDSKTLLNGALLPARVATTNGAAGLLDLHAAIDNLFGHTNVAPFIGKQLIQRFVTSNPSTGYVARVSAAFNNNGVGVRGDMKAVIKAILLDEEARDPVQMSNPVFGKLREPFLRVVNMARAFNAAASNGVYELDDFNMDHYQQVLNAPSVFNFYLPGYTPPGMLANAGLVGPEFQILNAGSAISAPNYFYQSIPGSLHPWGANSTKAVELNLIQEHAMLNDIDGLIRRLNLTLMYGNLSPQEHQIIREAAMRVTSGWQWELERVYLVIYLMVTSPEFAVMR